MGRNKLHVLAVGGSEELALEETGVCMPVRGEDVRPRPRPGPRGPQGALRRLPLAKSVHETLRGSPQAPATSHLSVPELWGDAPQVHTHLGMATLLSMTPRAREFKKWTGWHF